MRKVSVEEGQVVVETSRAHGKLRRRQVLSLGSKDTFWLSLAAAADGHAEAMRADEAAPRVLRWSPRIERLYGRGDMQWLLEDVQRETGLANLANADFIVDVGFGVGNRDGYEQVIEPLVQALRDCGVSNLAVGGSRKVTEELRLLAPDRQIGQSGVSVNPQVLLAIGVSGAPQHVNYIAARAVIVAFNRDPEAPLLMLNQRQAQPRVYPVLGDLFETVPAFTAVLRQNLSSQAKGDLESAAVSS